MGPDRLTTHYTQFRILKQLGDLDGAIEAYVVLARTHPPEGRAHAADVLAATYETSGYAPAMRALAEAVEAQAGARYVSAYGMAVFYTDADDADNAVRWLEIAYENHDTGLIWMNVDPALDALRSDPRFQDLLRRMNFPE